MPSDKLLELPAELFITVHNYSLHIYKAKSALKIHFCPEILRKFNISTQF